MQKRDEKLWEIVMMMREQQIAQGKMIDKLSEAVQEFAVLFEEVAKAVQADVEPSAS